MYSSAGAHSEQSIGARAIRDTLFHDAQLFADGDEFLRKTWWEIEKVEEDVIIEVSHAATEGSATSGSGYKRQCSLQRAVSLAVCLPVL